MAAKAGDRRRHNLRAGRAELLVAKAEAFGHTGAERVDHHVGVAREVLRDREISRIVEVEHHALLAAEPEGPRRLARSALPPGGSTLITSAPKSANASVV